MRSTWDSVDVLMGSAEEEQLKGGTQGVCFGHLVQLVSGNALSLSIVMCQLKFPASFGTKVHIRQVLPDETGWSLLGSPGKALFSDRPPNFLLTSAP